jgi:hypothetical protein
MHKCSGRQLTTTFCAYYNSTFSEVSFTSLWISLCCFGVWLDYERKAEDKYTRVDAALYSALDWVVLETLGNRK